MPKTPDGRWEYGIGEYQKRISDYLGYNSPSSNTSISGAIKDFFFPAGKVVSNLTYNAVSSITIPVFYIWAIGPDGIKRIIEWPFSKSTRDSMYPNFVLSMDAPITDLQRVTIMQQMQSTAGTPSMSNLSKWLATEQIMLKYNEITNQVIHQASQGAESAVIPLLIGTIAAVAILVFAFRKQ